MGAPVAASPQLPVPWRRQEPEPAPLRPRDAHAAQGQPRQEPFSRPQPSPQPAALQEARPADAVLRQRRRWLTEATKDQGADSVSRPSGPREEHEPSEEPVLPAPGGGGER